MTDAFLGMAPATYRGRLVAYIGLFGFGGVVSVNGETPASDSKLAMIVCKSTCTTRMVRATALSSDTNGRGIFTGSDSKYGKISLHWAPSEEMTHLENGFCTVGQGPRGWVYDSNWLLGAGTGVATTSIPSRTITGRIGSLTISRSACAVTVKDGVGEISLSMG